MSSNFCKCDLDLPATDEPAENVAGSSAEIGREEGLRVELAFWIADEKPADRHRRHAGTIPHGGAGGDFDKTIGSAVPETDAVALPRNFAILDDRRQLFQRFTLDRSPAAAFALLRWKVEQVGIETQPRDDTDIVANRGEEFDGCERAVTDQDNIAIGKPAMDLQGGLACPIKQRLGRPRLVGIEGGVEQGEKGQRHDAIG